MENDVQLTSALIIDTKSEVLVHGTLTILWRSPASVLLTEDQIMYNV